MIVSDSTTLIILSNFNKFSYLTNLFEKIYIPQAVYNEINFKNFENQPFIEIVNVKNDDTLKSLKLLLDIGESEAINLALQKNLPLIIDEKKGRKIAQNLGIKIIGLLGVVYLNIKKDFITNQEAREFLQMAKNGGYHISQKLIDEMFDLVK